MKKIEKLILMSSALLLSTGAWAQEFGDFGGFDDAGSDGAASKIEVSGSADIDLRAYTDVDDAKPEKIETDAVPSAKLNLKYNGNKSDVEVNLKIDEDTVKNHPVDIIDEAVLRGYFDNLTVEAGKMKVVWGKGDKLHVLDNFNADDYSDFIIPDYLDRRLSIPMIRAVYSVGVANIQIEGIYAPLLSTDRFATSGRWVPAQYTALTQGAKSLVSANLLGLEHKAELAEAALVGASGTGVATATAAALAADKTYLEYLSFANNLSAHPESIYPDVNNLKYGQYGVRVLGTAGTVDLGASYYYGWYKQPSVNYSAYLKSIDVMKAGIATAPTTLGAAYQSYLAAGKSSTDALQTLAVANGWQFALPQLGYDQKQTFGLEAASVLWHFNVRGEVAYNLTEDYDGTDPWVHNNSLQWLCGFDIDLPFANANLNVQETGTFILHGDECDKNQKKYAAYKAADADYSEKGYTNNKIVANLTMSFMNDKLAPEVTVMYGIERSDLVIMPKLNFKADQNLTLTASGMYINCGNDNSEFKAWEKNSFVSLGATYQF